MIVFLKLGGIYSSGNDFVNWRLNLYRNDLNDFNSF